MQVLAIDQNGLNFNFQKQGRVSYSDSAIENWGRSLPIEYI